MVVVNLFWEALGPVPRVGRDPAVAGMAGFCGKAGVKVGRYLFSWKWS